MSMQQPPFSLKRTASPERTPFRSSGVLLPHCVDVDSHDDLIHAAALDPNVEDHETDADPVHGELVLNLLWFQADPHNGVRLRAIRGFEERPLNAAAESETSFDAQFLGGAGSVVDISKADCEDAPSCGSWHHLEEPPHEMEEPANKSDSALQRTKQHTEHQYFGKHPHLKMYVMKAARGLIKMA